MQDASQKQYFVVREEGGNYEFVDRAAWYRLRPEVPIFGVQVGTTKVIHDRILEKQHGLSPFRRFDDVKGRPVRPPREIATKRDMEFWDQAIFDAMAELDERIETHLFLYEKDRDWLAEDYDGLPPAAANIALLSVAVGMINAAQMLSDTWCLESDPESCDKHSKHFEGLLERVKALIEEQIEEQMPPVEDA